MSSTSSSALTLTTVTQYLTLTLNFIILVVGTIGSICNIITFTAPKLRRNTCVFYLLCASISQFLCILFIVLSNVFSTNFGCDLEQRSIIYCKIRYYSAVVMPELATYFLLLSTLDRCLISFNNVRVRAWSQLKIAHRLSVGVVVFAVVSNIHLLLLYTMFNNNCQLTPGVLSTLLSSIFILFVGIILPHSLMFILCIVTFINMKRAKRRVATVLCIVNRQPLSTRIESSIVTVIVLQVVVSTILLLWGMVAYAYTTMISTNLNKTMEQRAIEAFALQLGISMYFLSYAISFYASILTSKFFRPIFWQIINGFYRRWCQHT